MVQACGLVTQLALSETEERKKKSRLMYDLSFSITNLYDSVNQRLNKKAYPKLIYSFYLLRIIHFIVALRLVLVKQINKLLLCWS